MATDEETSRETHRVARAYFDSWTSRKGPEALADLMAEDFRFQAGDMVIEGRDAFLGAGAWPDRAVTTMVAEAYTGETAIQIYEADNQGTSVRIADHLAVRNGEIISAEVFCDGAQFEAFMRAG